MSPTFRCVLATVGCCAGACEPRSRANMANNAGIASLIFTLPQPRHSSLPPAHYTPVPPLANSFRLNAGPPASAQAPSKDKVQSLAQLSHKRFPTRQITSPSLSLAESFHSHPRLHFRGLLELHSCYVLPGCSLTNRGLGYEAPARTSCPAQPLVSYHVNRQLHAWILPHR